MYNLFILEFYFVFSKYFQSDDPDLYINKVQYILDNDVGPMDLYFTDEEYNCNNGQLIGVNNDSVPISISVRIIFY